MRDLEDIRHYAEWCKQPPPHGTNAWNSYGSTLLADVFDLIAEVERLRTALTTTLVACERCERGVRNRHSVLGLCPTCAEEELVQLRRLDFWNGEGIETG